MAKHTADREFLDPEVETHRATFDPETESATDAVVRVVASVTGTETEALEPIESVVDPIVFDALVRRERREVQIRFVYQDQRVTVDSSGHIVVQPCQTDRGASQRFRFDESDATSDAVVRAVAATRGIDEMDVEPLYNHVDTEALDSIFDGTDGNGLVVSFRFDGLWIQVTGEDEVVVAR